MRLLFIFILLLPLSGWATDRGHLIVVPAMVQFANIRLKFTPGAYKRVQEKVNQLTRSKNSFNQTLERTHLFFPFIEKILADEKVPDDFKFQAVHESTLIGHAVSHTADVGFWQIQKATGLGLQLTINDLVDERMHLIQSTKAAARFLKINYQYFNSWLGALLAYNRGRAGAIKIFPKKHYGAKVVRLDDKTDDYIISVIATKVAFGEIAGKKKHPKWKILVYQQGHHGQKLSDIAAHFNIEEKLLYDHNRWLRTRLVPHNTKCSLLVPWFHTRLHMHPVLKLPKPLKSSFPQPKKNTTKAIPNQEITLAYHHTDYEEYVKSAKLFPKIVALKDPRSTRLIKANGIVAIVAKKEDTISFLAKLGNLQIDRFLFINDMQKKDPLIPGVLYYYASKASKGGRHYHIVASGEGIWDIAQRYGMKQAALLEKNRMKKVEPLQKGRVLWLRFIRPRNMPVEYYHTPPVLDAK